MSHFEYDCLLAAQRTSADAPHLAIFQAPVSEIRQWAEIRRLGEDQGGAQRQPSPAKVKAIARFLQLDDRNTIPTSITVTLDVPLGQFVAAIECGSLHRLSFDIDVADEATKPGLVIDGQHRILGMNAFDPTAILNVVAIVGAGNMEKAFQFLVINNKASKVATDHIRALVAIDDEAALKKRLQTARLTLDRNVGFVLLVNDEEDSPFQGIIDWPLTPEANRVVVPAAIEGSIAYIQQKKVRDFENEDVLLEYFFTIWRRIKTAWGDDLWNNKPSRLLSKVGVVCMTRYMTDALVNSYDLGQLDVADPDKVDSLVKELLEYQERQFWIVPWTSTSYDTNAGRALVVEALVQIARNKRVEAPWHEGIELVDAAG